jgi:hypothetical protein
MTQITLTISVDVPSTKDVDIALLLSQSALRSDIRITARVGLFSVESFADQRSLATLLSQKYNNLLQQKASDDAHLLALGEGTPIPRAG